MILEYGEDIMDHIFDFCNSDALQSFSYMCNNSNKLVKGFTVRKYHHILDNVNIKYYEDNKYKSNTYQKCMFIASYTEYVNVNMATKRKIKETQIKKHKEKVRKQ
jgi:hypothetical protein